MRVTSPDGTSLAVHVAGDPAGPVVVAVHGYPDNHAVWDGFAAEIGDDFRVVTYDVRGAGESDQPARRSGYRTERLVDDLVAVVDAVSDGRPVHLVAHDWGSIQCWPALTDPRLTGRIASYLSISGPSLDHAGHWLRDVRRHPLASAKQLAHSYYIDLFLLPRVPELAARAGLLDRAIASANARTHDAGARKAAPFRRERDKVNGINLYRANIVRTLARPRPEPIDLPVLVLAPDRDAYVGARMALEAPAPFVRDLRTATIAGGHWVIEQRPDVVAGEFRDFVAGLGVGDTAPLDRRERTAGTRG